MMTKNEALKKLEGRTGWLIRKTSGEFAILNIKRDPYWIKEAIYLNSPEQIEAAAEWMASAS